MPEFLRTATIVVALAVAAWAGVAVVRDRPPSRAQLISLWLVEAFAIALVATGISGLVGGHHVPSIATYIGYVVAFLAVPVAGWALARLEPSRWGSVIVATVGLVEAILVVRLEQVWTGL